jgi:hypothetical protein
VAFRYLEEDASTQVLVRRAKLTGYEAYLVEQWACSRTHPTFLITTYTGDVTHEVVCGVLSVPTDEDSWSPRLKVYFKALYQYHARRRETQLGTLMITNLSAFPSSLTVIPVPEGDPTKYREYFFINEDLKRLGCSGRTGLTLSKPAGSTVSKFYQLYRASEKIPVGQAVIELVKLCQVALMLFDKLEPEYADGLLCDLTEKALNDWWVEFGTEFYNIEPHDGILGPTTVAALLGLLIGARNRLHAYGAPISKDVFDIEHTKRAIAYFQKTQRLPKTRRLDHGTLIKLQRLTAKAANNEGWIVPRAIKGTVAELGGKSGEMVMDMVGARDKSGITEVESPDIEQFIASVGGARAKWLWHGKPRKGQSSGDMFGRLVGENPIEFQTAEGGGYEWASRRKESSIDSPKEGLVRTSTIDSERSKATNEDRHRLVKKHTIEREPSHKEHEPGRGLGRIKDAVSLRTHGSFRHSREESDHDKWKGSESSRPGPSPIPEIQSPGEDYISHHSVKSTDADSQASRNAIFQEILTESPAVANNSTPFLQNVEPPSDEETDSKNYFGLAAPIEFKQDRTERSSTASLVQSLYNGIDLDEILPVDMIPDHNVGTLLRRRHSLQSFPPELISHRHESFYPRRISFSIAEDSILRWDRVDRAPTPSEIISLPTYFQQLTASKLAADRAQLMRQQLLALEATIHSWVTTSVDNVGRLINQVRRDQDTLNSLYYPRLEEYHALESHSHDVLDDQKAILDETVREIEILGAKLDYEMNALRGKVDDVEDGVGEFELQVKSLEGRVREIERELQPKEGWGHWLMRITLGLGQPLVELKDSGKTE